ncbi:SpaA isopeptide-forming pilin-related protein [Rhodococcus sp. BH5]|uniref:SpaA isopeptide-forming pilin-related protein n=1 Tax=Rhodococcus sp. BH5 TaxID=2871702 RepID=UPI0022CD6AA8|nr:SpaA isopeptide-forming pilin-related protein [Rhodococcus sp. BH5]MCZ9635051.1 VaFE repeat-containing surface-anchored protein [Rhodococcus sp. BH5]
MPEATMVSGRQRWMLTTAVVAVLSVVLSVFTSASWARADAGEGLGLTGPGGYSGSYKLPDGDEGWCIDFLKAEPMANGGGNYAAAVPLEGVSAADLKIAVFALSEGNRALASGDGQLAAAVAAVLHSLSINQGAPWDESLPAEARADYDRIISSAPEVAEGASLQVRVPEGWTGDGTNSGFQRILSVQQPDIPTVEPSIGTSASLAGSNVITDGATVTDRVTYSGVVAGKSYTLDGELVCKATGTRTGGVGSKTFTADASGAGTVDVELVVADGDCVQQVVFEKLIDDSGAVVATHEDINDAAQTVGEKISTTTTAPSTTTPNTTTTANATPSRGPNGTLSVRKVAAGEKTDAALEGAQFEVRDGSGKVIEKFTTTRRASSIVLAEGSYELVETKAPKGYAVSEKPTSVDIVAERTTTVEVANALNPIIDVNKYSSVDGEYLAGAKFRLLKGGETVTEWTSKDEVTSLIVDPGEYEIVEVEAPAGYVKLDKPQKVVVAGGDHKALNITNAPDVSTPEGQAEADKPAPRKPIASIPSGPTTR